jgi:hypothetical protein
MSGSVLLAAAPSEHLLQALLIVVLVAVGAIAVGVTALVLRIILPGVARPTDRALASMGTARLFLAGVLPLVGAALLARGVQLAGSGVLTGVYLVVVALPVCLALVAGAMAGLPHLGRRVLRAGADPAPLVEAALGGLVAGLAMVTWALRPLGVLVTLLLAAWFVGIGLGAVLGGRRRAPDAGDEGAGGDTNAA